LQEVLIARLVDQNQAFAERMWI